MITFLVQALKDLGAFWGALLGAVLSALITWYFSARRMPASYRIAVLGFPKSGKTTLITAVFAYLFRRGVRGASIVPRGEETIQRISDNMEKLELGRPIGPTTDQDVFAYRAEVSISGLIFTARYKLEIGDFPGENTVDFAETYGDWLHRTKYFEWAVGADAFVFVLDTGAILLDESGEYVARQKRAFRAAWQRLQEHYLDGPADLSRRPLILVFTKADSLVFGGTAEELRSATMAKEFARATTIPRGQIESIGGDIRARLRDLIEYFERESRRFRVVLTSVFLNVDDERLGIPEVAHYIMPRPGFFALPVAQPIEKLSARQ